MDTGSHSGSHCLHTEDYFFPQFAISFYTKYRKNWRRREGKQKLENILAITTRGQQVSGCRTRRSRNTYSPYCHPSPHIHHHPHLETPFKILLQASCSRHLFSVLPPVLWTFSFASTGRFVLNLPRYELGECNKVFSWSYAGFQTLHAELECLLLVWWAGLKSGNSKLIFAWKFPSKHPGMTSNWVAYSPVMTPGIIKNVDA